jgi:hypothetical protein
MRWRGPNGSAVCSGSSRPRSAVAARSFYETLSQGVADDDALLGPAHRDDSLLAMADSYLRWLAPARNAADAFQWLPANPDSN